MHAAVGEMEALGITNTVSTEQPDWPKRVAALTGGAPIVRAVESIGGEAANQLASVLGGWHGAWLGQRLLGENALLMSFGSLTFKPLVIGAEHLVFKQTTVKGYWASKRVAATPPAELARMMGELVRLAVTGALQLPVDAVHDLADASSAMAAAERPGRAGKVLLKGA